MSIDNPEFKAFSDCPLNNDSCQERHETIKRLMTNTSNVELANKNLSKVNNPQPGNLIPTNYNQFIFTMLSDQKKWNLIFGKLIAVIDRLDKENQFFSHLTPEEAEAFLWYEEVMLLSH